MLKKKKKIVMEDARQGYEKNNYSLSVSLVHSITAMRKKTHLKRELKIRHTGQKTCTCNIVFDIKTFDKHKL